MKYLRDFNRPDAVLPGKPPNTGWATAVPRSAPGTCWPAARRRYRGHHPGTRPPATAAEQACASPGLRRVLAARAPACGSGAAGDVGRASTTPVGTAGISVVYPTGRLGCAARAGVDIQPGAVLTDGSWPPCGACGRTTRPAGAACSG